jgi:hypothetical protein
MRILMAALVSIGCTGQITGPSGDLPDGGAANDSPTGQPDAPSAEIQCRPKVAANLPDGEHNPGQDCNGACHDHGFTLAGTLYTSAAGTAPFTGGTITIIDANGVVTDAVSASNGNFYTSKAVAFPAKVIASACPDVRPMVTLVTQADGGCYKGGCHVAGATGPIHVP